MKKMIVFCLLAVIVSACPAQSYEVQQLLLDWTKLTQMKGILKDMKTGYQIVSKGYSTIKDISEGNFNLHETFLDGLWLVSPAIRQYWKIPEIITMQVQLSKEYKNAFQNYKRNGAFSPDEILYLSNVYNNLFEKSIKGLNELTIILTANQLRMSDDERLAGVDKVYNDISNQLQFLRDFNSQTSVLQMQRVRALQEIKSFKNLSGITQ